MLTSIEKLNFVKRILNNKDLYPNVKQIQLELHKLILRDTTNGKLYKYRSFDNNGYSLNNLKNGTLHCSNPTEFNDPFDSKIGATFESLYKAKFDNELETISEILEKFYLVINKEINVFECTQDEQRVITKLMSKQTIMQFIAENKKQNYHEEETDVLLKKNTVVLLELLETVLGDKKLKPSFGICASLLPLLISKLDNKSLFKLSSQEISFEDFAKANGITIDADEIELTMLISKKINPMLAEAVIDVENLLDSKEKLFTSRLSEMFLVGCLCTDFKNRLMWSHYADGHRGFCIEYDYSNVDELNLNQLPLPVIYDKKRPLIPWKAALNNTPENIQEATSELATAVLIKDNAWEYENEWRIIIDTNEDENLKMPKISCIYLGAAINESNRASILEIAKINNIPVKQMKIDRGTYDLHAKPL